MADIKLDKSETALWNEVGSRGEHFRAAIRDRAVEEVRVSRQVSRVIDSEEQTVDLYSAADPVPESGGAPLPPAAEAAATVEALNAEAEGGDHGNAEGSPR